MTVTHAARCGGHFLYGIYIYLVYVYVANIAALLFGRSRAFFFLTPFFLLLRACLILFARCKRAEMFSRCGYVSVGVDVGVNVDNFE